MKNKFYQNKKLEGRVALFYSFANLCDVYLNGKQVDSHICFCCGMLFWLKYTKKMWPHTDLLLEKGGLF